MILRLPWCVLGLRFRCRAKEIEAFAENLQRFASKGVSCEGVVSTGHTEVELRLNVGHLLLGVSQMSVEVGLSVGRGGGSGGRAHLVIDGDVEDFCQGFFCGQLGAGVSKSGVELLCALSGECGGFIALHAHEVIAGEGEGRVGIVFQLVSGGIGLIASDTSIGASGCCVHGGIGAGGVGVQIVTHGRESFQLVGVWSLEWMARTSASLAR